MNKSKKECSLLTENGYADKLNTFYARFDDTNFSREKDDISSKLTAILESCDDGIAIDINDVNNVLSKINVKKACGPDRISGSLIKTCRNSLSFIIHYIYQLSARYCPKLQNSVHHG